MRTFESELAVFVRQLGKLDWDVHAWAPTQFECLIVASFDVQLLLELLLVLVWDFVGPECSTS